MNAKPWLSLLCAVGAMIHAKPSVAQAPSRDQLIGTWLHVAPEQGVDALGLQALVRERFIAFRADGTWQEQVFENGVDLRNEPKRLRMYAGSYASYPHEGHWYLITDTLWFANPDSLEAICRAKRGPESSSHGECDDERWLRAFSVALQGHQLLVRQYSDEETKICTKEVFSQLGASSPMQTSWKPEPPPTLTREQLTGTWTMRGVIDSTQIDTLTLRADSMWTWTFKQKDQINHGTGNWYLLGGDRLWLTDSLPEHQSTTFGIGKVTLRPGEFTVASDFHPCRDAQIQTTYKRVP